MGFFTHGGHSETIPIVVPQVKPSVQQRLHVVTSFFVFFYQGVTTPTQEISHTRCVAPDREFTFFSHQSSVFC